MNKALSPADEWALASRQGSLIAAPSSDPQVNMLIRTFLFVDICGFTSFIDKEGALNSYVALRDFRNRCREVSANRGVRIAKWLGDGFMAVATDPALGLCAAAEALTSASLSGLEARAAVATGPAMLFEGDDYIGRPVNLAARLCDIGEPSELLADLDSAQAIPIWLQRSAVREVEVRGMDSMTQVVNITSHTEGVPST